MRVLGMKGRSKNSANKGRQEKKEGGAIMAALEEEMDVKDTPKSSDPSRSGRV